MTVTSRGRSVPAEQIAERSDQPEFAQKVYDIIEPGTTVIIPISRSCGAVALPQFSKVSWCYG